MKSENLVRHFTAFATSTSHLGTNIDCRSLNTNNNNWDVVMNRSNCRQIVVHVSLFVKKDTY